MNGKIIQGGLFVFIAGMMLFSCLSDDSKGKIVGNQIGVIVDNGAGKHLLDVYQYGNVYDAMSFETVLKPDSCYLINFRIDTLSSENSASSVENNGYRTVELLDYLHIDRGGLQEGMTDTAQLLNNEQIIVNPVARSYAYHKAGRLVLFTSYNKFPEQSSTWELSYDPNNRFTTGSSGNNTYLFFLRSTILTAVKDTADTTRTSVAYSPNAFDIKEYMEKIRQEEAAKGRDSFYFRIWYLSNLRLRNDTLIKTWSRTDSLLFLMK